VSDVALFVMLYSTTGKLISAAGYIIIPVQTGNVAIVTFVLNIRMHALPYWQRHLALPLCHCDNY